MTTSGPDTDLFALFANAETRLILETLLRGAARQSELAATLGIDTRPLGTALRKLEVAGLAVRSSPRGQIRLTDFDAIAGLLEAEASLSEEIQNRKAKKARQRYRELRKNRMQGGVHGTNSASKSGSQ